MSKEWFDLHPGVKAKRIGGHDGAGIYVVEMAARAEIPLERHPQRETLVLLRGDAKVAFASEIGGAWMLLRSEPPVCNECTIDPDEYHRILALDHGATLMVVADPDFEVSRGS